METLAIDVLGITVQEPMTLFTDLLITFACFSYGYGLTGQRRPGENDESWLRFFLLIGTSTLLGGLGHAFHYAAYGPTAQLASWLITGLAVFFAELASIRTLQTPWLKTLLFWQAPVRLVLFVFAVLVWREFFIVKINTTIGLAGVVMLIHGYTYFSEQERGSALIVLGVLIAAVAPIIHALKISPSPWFNHNDLSHIVMIISLYVVAGGVRASNASALLSCPSSPEPSDLTEESEVFRVARG